MRLSCRASRPNGPHDRGCRGPGAVQRCARQHGRGRRHQGGHASQEPDGVPGTHRDRERSRRGLHCRRERPGAGVRTLNAADYRIIRDSDRRRLGQRPLRCGREDPLRRVRRRGARGCPAGGRRGLRARDARRPSRVLSTRVIRAAHLRQRAQRRSDRGGRPRHDEGHRDLAGHRRGRQFPHGPRRSGTPVVRGLPPSGEAAGLRHRHGEADRRRRHRRRH